MKKIVLLRHDESVWTQENRFTGRTDVPLSDKGIEEARKAGVSTKKALLINYPLYGNWLRRFYQLSKVVGHIRPSGGDHAPVCPERYRVRP